MSDPKEIAYTTMVQLGGIEFLHMVNGELLKCSKDGRIVEIAFQRANDDINRLTVELNEKDLYDMKFFCVRGVVADKVKYFNDLYAEQLDGIFKNVTGLATKRPKVIIHDD